jgi:hypothetical protein
VTPNKQSVEGTDNIQNWKARYQDVHEVTLIGSLVDKRVRRPMERELGAAKLIDLIDDVSCMTMHIDPEESGRLSPLGRCQPGY